ncbi:hypothetical protein J8L98_21765 [Pseudoalteromonas sp. MMG013]|uniref:hypothetical protein n=1 Tax=Pseudoalteromonas sp. MMG013 TaxID=2822687 RepID=UPI001B36A914|nr:hypothetical protein [Pseudoalteromonas sp. MMG013]MBQ4864322.1 hypothetical protein [Pseudoalteromonas sp. MMG013]
MNTRLKKGFVYSVSILLLSGTALYVSMEDYQKERVGELLGKIVSDSDLSSS